MTNPVIVEINGKAVNARQGQMIIELADELGVPIPRFCYHKELSIAANCRQCLVEIDKSNKPVPACATPVTNGMKIYTQSPKAIQAQQSVMEFLLINHPLDCPICDQGGECELQDVAMGYGSGKSHYTEEKRVVADEDFGPLISTEMTRCIHCTRCVRVGREIAGLSEIGLTGRGEQARIATFVKHSLVSELSGNMIDVCPVGALTSKPYRFKARAWELTQHPSIAPYDCLGSSIYVHLRRNQIMRIIPRENPDTNGVWLSDRDRFGYLGATQSRLETPLIKQQGAWVVADWNTALTRLSQDIMHVTRHYGPKQIAGLATPNATVEEGYVFQKLLRTLGCPNIDHRLREIDTRDQSRQDLKSTISFPYASLSQADTYLLISSHLNHELPLAGVKIRAAVQAGATVMAIHSIAYDYRFSISLSETCSPDALPLFLLQMVIVLAGREALPTHLQSWISTITVSPQALAMAEKLKNAQSPLIIMGLVANQHPEASWIRVLIQIMLENLPHCRLLPITEGCNTAGARFSGLLPHLAEAGLASDAEGLSFKQAIEKKLKAYIVLGAELERDSCLPQSARSALQQADLTCVMTPYTNQAMLDYADILLPIATPFETEGTFINLEGRWQSFDALVVPHKEAKPAWKVIYALAQYLQLDALEGFHPKKIIETLKILWDKLPQSTSVKPIAFPEQMMNTRLGLQLLSTWPIYQTHPMLRRAEALQVSAAQEKPGLYVNPSTATHYALHEDHMAHLKQNEAFFSLPVYLDPRIADNTAYIPAGFLETSQVMHTSGTVTLC